MSYVKVYKFKKQISLDNGATWNDVIPTEYKLSGEPIGYYDTSAECELGPIKLSLTLNDSSTVKIECDSTSAVTSGEVATQYSGTVISAEIGDCVTSIGDNAFINCTSLTSCTLGSGSTSIGEYAFQNCSSLSSIDIPNSVTTINRRAFQNCSGLINVTIGDGITEIGYGAFYGCTSLVSITVNATTPPTLVTTAFYNTNECPIYVPCASVDAYKAASGWSAYVDRIQGIPPCVQPTFNGKYRLTLSDSSTVSAECDSTSAVTYYEIVPTYSGTVLSAEIGDCVTTIGNQAFHDCKSLKNVIIGSGVTSIGYEAFYLSNRISGVTINATTPPTLGESAFLSYPEYPIYVPCDRIDAYKRAWPDYADRITCKYDAKFVLTLYDSREITAACDSTSAISRNEVSTYMYSAVKAVIGDCVTTINHFGFYNCTSLSSVTIPDSVTIIGNQAFLECRNISKITINSTIPPYVGYDSFGDSTYHYGIYVPSESVNAYKTAWPNYADRIFANPYN